MQLQDLSSVPFPEGPLAAPVPNEPRAPGGSLLWQNQPQPGSAARPARLFAALHRLSCAVPQRETENDFIVIVPQIGHPLGA